MAFGGGGFALNNSTSLIRPHFHYRRCGFVRRELLYLEMKVRKYYHYSFNSSKYGNHPKNCIIYKQIA
jgi:hypothetical protein